MTMSLILQNVKISALSIYLGLVFESMLKVLPERFQNKRARLRYFEFVEYFGVLHENGMVSEPEPIVIVEDEEEEKEVKTSNKEEASDE